MEFVADFSSSGIAILIPVFNDWPACRMLLKKLDELLGRYKPVDIFIVDDGSAQEIPQGCFIDKPPRSLGLLRVIRLRRNLGHQRALCVGLCVMEARTGYQQVVVMDADGEDAPSDVPRLIDHAQANPAQVVFAQRTKRSESIVFRVGYVFFKWVHRAATGEGISFGNFSVIPRERLRSLVLVSDLWSNYPASILSSRQTYCWIPTVRAPRLTGEPKMNFVRLVVHGLSAIAVFGETLAVRLVLLTMGILAMALLIILAGLTYALITHTTYSRGAILLSGLGLISVLQAATFSVLFAFGLLNRRNESNFIPIRDYPLYVDRIYPHPLFEDGR